MIVAENVIDIAFPVALAGLTVSSFCFKISFTLTIQSGFTILDPNFDHGVYMSVRHVLPDLYFIFMDYWFVKFMSNFHDKVSSFISLKPRLSIFGTYIDHGEYWSVSHISPAFEFDLFFMVYWFYSIYIKILWFGQFPYNLGSLYLVHTCIIESRCQQGIDVTEFFTNTLTLHI